MMTQKLAPKRFAKGMAIMVEELGLTARLQTGTPMLVIGAAKKAESLQLGLPVSTQME